MVRANPKAIALPARRANVYEEFCDFIECDLLNTQVLHRASLPLGEEDQPEVVAIATGVVLNLQFLGDLRDRGLVLKRPQPPQEICDAPDLGVIDGSGPELVDPGQSSLSRARFPPLTSAMTKSMSGAGGMPVRRVGSNCRGAPGSSRECENRTARMSLSVP